MWLNSVLSRTCLPALLIGNTMNANSIPNIDFSGFATFAFAQTITDDNKESPFEGMSNAIEFGYFNKLGLRADANLKDNLCFTLQAISNGNNDYQPKIDWAFVNYRASNQLKLSAGRLRFPLYMYSEFKDVSYAYQWIVPPYAVYGSPSFATFNGGKVDYMTNLPGDWSTHIEFWTGQLKDKLEVGGIGGRRVDFSIDDILGTSITFDRDWLTIRAAYMHGLSSSDIAPLIVTQLGASEEITAFIDTLTALGIKLSDILQLTESKAVTLENDTVQFFGLGTTIDVKNVFFSAEATHIVSMPNIIVGKATSYYFMTGYRAPFDLTFSITYARDFNRPLVKTLNAFKADFQQLATNYENTITLEQQAEIFKDAEGILVNKYSTLDTTSYIFNTRWDFHPMASLKAEYLYKKQRLLDLKSSPQAIRIALDLVF